MDAERTETGGKLHLVVVDWQTARGFCQTWHRHHPKPPPGHKFCTGVAADGLLVGVAIVASNTLGGVVKFCRVCHRVDDDVRLFSDGNGDFLCWRDYERTAPRGYVQCPSCAYEKPRGLPCGEPCV